MEEEKLVPSGEGNKPKKQKLTPFFEMLKEALNIWWTNLLKIIKVYVWGLLYALIPLVVIFSLFILNTVISGSSFAFWIFMIFVGFWAVLFFFYFVIRTFLSMFLLVKKNFVGSAREIFKESANYFWSYLALEITAMLVLFLWFFALVIPAIIFSIFYCLAVYAFFFEGKRDIDALKRSRELVKGYWWAVFGRTLFLGIIFGVFLMIVSWPLEYMNEGTLIFSLWNGFVQTINFLIGPIALLFSYRIYKDLVNIKK